MVVVVLVDGVVCGMFDVLLSVVDGVVALEFEFIVESAGRVAGSLLVCA